MQVNEEMGSIFFRGVRGEKGHKVNGVSQLDLWHKRMGHLSLKVTRLIPNVSKDSEHENKACYVCQRAKQTRDSFSLSNHNAIAAFEFIRCDFWGPYRTSSSCGASYFLTILD